MPSIAVLPTASAHSLRIIALVLGLTAAVIGAAFGPAAARAMPATPAANQATPENATKLKAVVIVGPTHSSTAKYIELGESLAKTAESYGMDVRRVFHPRATPERVLANIQGANIVAYFGHGNGWPSPYAPFQEKTKNGFGLNPYDGASQNDVAYRGGNWIRNNVTLAPNAVVLLRGLCYAEGNGEPGMAIPSWDVAHQRVDNFAAAFLYTGAAGVFAYGWQSPNSIVDMLHTTDKTMDEIFMTRGAQAHPYYGFVGWNDKYLDSVRMPGFKNHLDPHLSEGFLRAVSGNLSVTASQWSGQEPVADAPPPPDDGPSVPTGLALKFEQPNVVNLSWNASTMSMTGTLKYRVVRNGSRIATQQATTFTDKPTKSGTYTYQVRAVDPAGNASDLSESVSVTLSLGPGVPQGLAGTPMDSRKVALSWEATTSPSGTVQYRVFRNGNAIGVLQTATRYTDQPFKTGSFQYQVRAVDAAGNRSDLSPAITVQVVNALDGGDTTAPSVPTGLAGTPQDNRVVELRWNASTDDGDGTLRYRVFRNGSAIGTLQTGRTYTDRPASTGDFRYKVRAVDAAGNRSALSPSITVHVVESVSGGSSDASTPDTTPPSVPTGLTTESLGYRRILITWNASTDDRSGTIEYALFRGTKRIARLTETTFTHRPWKAGTKYYKVRAIDAAGNRSAFTEPVAGYAIKGPI